MMEPGSEKPEGDGEIRNPQPEASGSQRLGNPTRLTPRRPPAGEPDPVPEDPATTDDELRPYPAVIEDDRGRFRGGGSQFGGMFAPRSFGDGKIQVWGCSPGCLIASLLVSVLLTLLLNALL